MELLKQYGPLVGMLLAFIGWQAHWISKLLDRHERAYSGEILRMHQHMNRLLDHVLGPQPSSENMPRVKDWAKEADNSQKKLPGPNDPGSEGGK